MRRFLEGIGVPLENYCNQRKGIHIIALKGAFQ